MIISFASTGLESVEIPKSVGSVGTRAFDNCSSLLKFLIEEGMKGEIGNYVLDRSPLESLRLPRSLWSDNKLIGERAFGGSSLKTVTFSCVKDSSECVNEKRTYKGKEGVTIVCEACSAEGS